MPIFSILYVFLLIYIFIRLKTYKDTFFSLLVLATVLQIYFFQGYFLKIGSNEISSCAFITMKILVVYSFYLLLSGRVRVSISIFKGALLFLGVIALSMLVEYLHPYDGLLLVGTEAGYSWDDYVAGRCQLLPYTPNLNSFVRPFYVVFEFTTIILVFKQLCDFESLARVVMKIVQWGKWGIYYGVIEFILKNILGNTSITYDIAAVLFGVNAESILTSAEKKGGIFYSLQGATREPSHFIIYLFSIGVFMLLGNILYKKAQRIGLKIEKPYSNITLGVCIVVMLLTGGFSSVWFSFILIILAMFLKIREGNESPWSLILRHKTWLFIFCVISLFVFLFIQSNDYLTGRMQDAISVASLLGDGTSVAGLSVLTEGNEGVGSTIARFVSIYMGVQVFLDNPILGISPDIQNVHDTTMTMLSGIGLAGVISLYYFFTRSRYNYKYDWLLLFLIIIFGGFPMAMSPSIFSVYYAIIAECSTVYMSHDRSTS